MANNVNNKQHYFQHIKVLFWKSISQLCTQNAPLSTLILSFTL